jgi:hypothetical protein
MWPKVMEGSAGAGIPARHSLERVGKGGVGSRAYLRPICGRRQGGDGVGELTRRAGRQRSLERMLRRGRISAGARCAMGSLSGAGGRV